jgi:hypothetical protein
VHPERVYTWADSQGATPIMVNTSSGPHLSNKYIHLSLSAMLMALLSHANAHPMSHKPINLPLCSTHPHASPFSHHPPSLPGLPSSAYGSVIWMFDPSKAVKWKPAWGLLQGTLRRWNTDCPSGGGAVPPPLDAAQSALHRSDCPSCHFFKNDSPRVSSHPVG